MKTDDMSLPASPDSSLSPSLPSLSDTAREESWLRATWQLDIRDSGLRIQVQKLTQLLSEPRARAVAIHDFIKSLPFAVQTNAIKQSASQVLRSACGDCHAKGVLFVAMLRAAGIPARLRFVSMPTRYLDGLLDAGSPSMIHAIGEVWLGNRWVQTDTYVVDQPMLMQSRAMLMMRQMRLGFGVHLDADQTWDGHQDAHAQSVSSDPVSMPKKDWGVAHDLRHFYAKAEHVQLRPTMAMAIKWRLGAQIVNHKIHQLRAGNLG
jgi:hypothetical protein